MSVKSEEQPAPDFELAATFLRLARAAHDCGDNTQFVAARKLLLVALCVPDAPPMKRVA